MPIRKFGTGDGKVLRDPTDKQGLAKQAERDHETAQDRAELEREIEEK